MYIRKPGFLMSGHIYILHLKPYANHLSGIQVMAIISLQCNSLSQIHSSVYFRLKIV